MGGDEAKRLFDLVVSEMKQNYQGLPLETLKRIQFLVLDDKIETGVFGAMMEVDIVNDGPVTIEFDSTESRPKK